MEAEGEYWYGKELIGEGRPQKWPKSGPKDGWNLKGL